LAILIATNPEAYTRQYVWDCFIKTAEIISPEKKAQELENTSLCRNTVAKHEQRNTLLEGTVAIE
jgi:hypothetical protein